MHIVDGTRLCVLCATKAVCVAPPVVVCMWPKAGWVYVVLHPPLFYCAAYQSAIIGVFPRGLALFDATVHFSCICFVLAAPWISSVRSQ